MMLKYIIILVNQAQLNAHAYAQGNEIYLGSGQEKHLPHEAWHIVQQKQGRVKPTMQMKGKVSINDDNSLEKEADIMGAKTMKIAHNFTTTTKENKTAENSVKQLTKKKNIGGTLAGATALGAYGGSVLGSAIPVIGTVGGGIIGGIVGAGIGALIGYFLSKPKLYKNNQAAHYEDEIAQYTLFKEQHADAASAYDRGSIIKYSPRTSNAFNTLLHMGKVLYVYDKNSQLSIGSNSGSIKHAIVGEGKQVKAAGMAVVNYSDAQVNKGEYDTTAAKITHWSRVLEGVQEQAQRIIEGFDDSSITLQDMADSLSGQQREAFFTYKTCLDQLEYWRPEMERLQALDHEDIVASKNNNVQLDNESGHYHPGPKTKSEAYEGWNTAGYHNLTWKSH